MAKKQSGFAKLAQESGLYTQEKLMPVSQDKHSFFLGLPNARAEDHINSGVSSLIGK